MLERGGGGGATGLLNKGGGSNRLPGLVTKQQAVEFPQVQTSLYNITLSQGPVSSNDTLGSTSFKLISVLIKVFSVLSMLSKLPPVVCLGGGQQAC